VTQAAIRCTEPAIETADHHGETGGYIAAVRHPLLLK
jgi:hypothetical protein